MASVLGEINRIEQAKTDVKGAIIDCGVDVPSTAKIDTYANYIRTIPQSVFSQFTSSKVGGTDKFIQSVELKNGVISATTGGLVSTTASGLAPKIPSTAAGTIDSSTTDWVLTYNNGSIGWYKLPSGAFCTDTNVTQTNTTGNSTYRVLLSGSANDTTDTTTARKSAKLLFNTSSGKMDLSGSLLITTSIADHSSPTAQCLVINSTAVPSGTTLSLKNSPGIGFHIANSSWASLVWGPGGFNFINSSANGYELVNASVIKCIANDKYISITPANSSYIHYTTDASIGHYFNTTVHVNGTVAPYGNNLFTSGTTSYRWSNVYAVKGNFSGQITSSVAEGTAPFVITSTKVNEKLNSDMIDGKHVWVGSQASYNSLTKNGDTIYFII